MGRHGPFPYSPISSLFNHPSPIPQLTSTQLAWGPITSARGCFTDSPQVHSKAQCRALCGKRPQILKFYYCNEYNVGITECDLDNWVFCGGFIQCGFLIKHLLGVVRCKREVAVRCEDGEKIRGIIFLDRERKGYLIT
jgi:hypothetical protein